MVEGIAPQPAPSHTELTSISHTRLVAEKHKLHQLLDAYETFCTHGHLSLSWTLLLQQLEIALSSQSAEHLRSEGSSSLLIEDSLPNYLRRLDIKELGYLASDLVIALFQVRGVLSLTDHFSLDRKFFSLTVKNWTSLPPDAPQAAVRAQLQRLQPSHLRVLLLAVNSNISSRTTSLGRFQVEAQQHRSTSTSWVACTGSHHALLLHLDLYLSDSLLISLEEAAGYSRPTQRWSFEPKIRASSQSKRRLALPWRKSNTTSPPVALKTITEDADGRSSEIISKSGIDVTDSEQRQMTMSHDEEDRANKRNSKRSSYSDYKSALSHLTRSSRHGSVAATSHRRSVFTYSTTLTRSSMGSFFSTPSITLVDETETTSQWKEVLEKHRIVPDPELENWSDGRGQHAEYAPNESGLIPLEHERYLGKGGTATVDSVRCKRVRLVRKIIECNGRPGYRQEDAVSEVQQLYKAQHAHIVRLVGTYIVDNILAILTYPRAEWNLEQFLSSSPSVHFDRGRVPAIRKFFGCLANVLSFIHSFPIKHMDIKPQNILVRAIHLPWGEDPSAFKIYLTDFGSSRFYESVEESETENPTPFTRTYAAREVVLQDFRGLKADVFSMGCVFVEMLQFTLGVPRASLLRARGARDSEVARPFYLRLENVYDWLMKLQIDESDAQLLAIRLKTLEMLSEAPKVRPSAGNIVECFRPWRACPDCDHPIPEAFEKAEWDAATDSSLAAPT